ncbi:hypothetical protein AALB16_09240 [Lachnospiraceae bacterium 62-35]
MDLQRGIVLVEELGRQQEYIPYIRQQANLRLASTARVSKVMNLHPDDLERIEELYIHFMDGTLPKG